MYCPACATVIAPGQTVCPACGEQVAAPIESTPVAGLKRPANVVQACILMVLSTVVSLAIFAVSVARTASISMFPLLAVIPTLLTLAITALLWVRLGFMRWLLVAFTVLSVFTLISTMVRFPQVSSQPTWLMGWAFLALRCYVLYLLFQPDSNAWFQAPRQLNQGERVL